MLRATRIRDETTMSESGPPASNHATRNCACSPTRFALYFLFESLNAIPQSGGLLVLFVLDHALQALAQHEQLELVPAIGADFARHFADVLRRAMNLLEQRHQAVFEDIVVVGAA